MRHRILAAAAAALLVAPAAAQEAPSRPQVQLRPPPAWMTNPPSGPPKVELRRAPDWLITPEQGRPQGQRPAAPRPAEPAAPPAAPRQSATPPPAGQSPSPQAAAPPAARRLGIGREDPRVPVDPAVAPWRGVGRLQRDGATCTGALVGPRSVVTAAHCLVGGGEDGKRIMPASAFRFLLGFERGRWVAEARVRAIRVDPDFDASAASPGPDWADWALLTLDRPLGTPDRVLPLLRRVPLASDRAMVGGYQQDRRDVLLADPDCRVVGTTMHDLGRPMLLHDCTATRGASGGPVLVELPEAGGWAVAGVLVAMRRGMPIGVAVPAEVLPELE
ncbi:trypsin-like serine peptidase [Falsiroseomonas bella]|nr:trypsin-like peptidase domain-containing protein [Falsiroseomonas bella]